METAQIFQSGDSQAVRLPKAYGFQGSEVKIYKQRSRQIDRRQLKLLKLLGPDFSSKRVHFLRLFWLQASIYHNYMHTFT